MQSFIKMHKLLVMAKEQNTSPVGKSATAAADARAERSEGYRAARNEYQEIEELRERNWLAAHIRERRYDLDLTQKQLAERVGTSHSHISRIEAGDHFPTLPALAKILAELDETLLLAIQDETDAEAPPEMAPLPELVPA